MDSHYEAYQITRKRLDELGYSQPFTVESTILVKTMLNDLKALSDAFMKTKRSVSFIITNLPAKLNLS